ncbi:MAG: hypothetical protein HY329_25405 [Chloroflexi bacterium]|nr:hypothetical protein [Chloroflexota bacterium]
MIATIPVGASPTAVAVNPNTNRIYVASSDGTLSVVDGTSNTVVTKTVIAPPRTDPSQTFQITGPHSVAVNQATERVYVSTNQFEANVISELGAVIVLDGTTMERIASVNLGLFSRPDQFRGIAVDSTHNRVYVTGRATDSSI